MAEAILPVSTCLRPARGTGARSNALRTTNLQPWDGRRETSEMPLGAWPHDSPLIFDAFASLILRTSLFS